MRSTMLAALILVHALGIGDARADLGHQAYARIMDRERARKNKIFEAKLYSCKRRGTPLIAIDRFDDEAHPTRLVMYRGGAVHLSQGDVTLEACIPRRTNDWISGQLHARISWKTTPAASTCEVSRVMARVTVLARERLVDGTCVRSLGVKARERLVEIEAVLLAAVRSAND